MTIQFDLEKRDDMLDIRTIDPDAHLVLSLGDFLSDSVMDLDELVIKETELAFSILSERPSSMDNLEGRGAYHSLAAAGELERFVYVKGVGSVQSFDQIGELIESDMYKYPGFAASRESLFFDEIRFGGTSHPRTLGTETLRWAGLEMINAYLIFKGLTKLHDIKSIQEARDMGLTIPLGVAKFPELGELLASSVNTMALENNKKTSARSLEWRGNREGMGTVALEVPSNKRVFGGVNLENPTDDQLSDAVFNPGNYRIVAKTIKSLLQVGFVYSDSSAHLQNIYSAPNSICAQADNSDLVHLGSIDDLVPTEQNYNLERTATVDDQQIYLLFTELSGRFTPPLTIEKKYIEHRALKDESLISFYSELFEDDLNLPQIQKLISLLPMYDHEIKTAMAISLHQKYKSEVWIDSGKEHTELLNSIPGVDVVEEYRNKKKNNFEKGIGRHLQITDSKKETIDLFLEYMKNKDESVLNQIKGLAEFETVREAANVLEPADQEELLLNLWEMNHQMDEFSGSYFQNAPEDWFEHRIEILTEITEHLQTDPESAKDYVANLYGIFRHIGIQKSIAGFNGGIAGYLEVLNYTKKDSFGLKEGVKRQKYLINSGEFFYMNFGGFQLVEDTLNGVIPKKSIYDQMFDRGLNHISYQLGEYFESVFVGDQATFDQVHNTIDEYFETQNEIYPGQDPELIEDAITRLNELADTFDVPATRMWHYQYLSKIVFGGVLEDTDSQRLYQSKVMDELELMSAAKL